MDEEIVKRLRGCIIYNTVFSVRDSETLGFNLCRYHAIMLGTVVIIVVKAGIIQAGILLTLLIL